VNVAPIIPGLTDEEAPRILEAAADRGATSAGYTMLRLPGAVREVFVDWLDRHAPHRKDRVLRRLRSLRDGDLNDPEFGVRMTGTGIWADTIGDLFRLARRKHGIDGSLPPLNTDAFRRRPGGQIGLFESAAGPE
jgi:DNA repair photolyase